MKNLIRKLLDKSIENTSKATYGGPSKVTLVAAKFSEFVSAWGKKYSATATKALDKFKGYKTDTVLVCVPDGMGGVKELDVVTRQKLEPETVVVEVDGDTQREIKRIKRLTLLRALREYIN